MLGSSRSSTAGRMASTPASAARRFSPPESWNGTRSAASAIPTARSASPARARASSGVAPRFSGPKATSSSTVGLKSWSSGFWNTTPTVCGSLLRCAGSAGSSPLTDASPGLPGSTPHSRRNSVVLPAPLGPTSATHSPGSTANVTPSRAVRPPA